MDIKLKMMTTMKYGNKISDDTDIDVKILVILNRQTFH